MFSPFLGGMPGGNASQQGAGFTLSGMGGGNNGGFHRPMIWPGASGTAIPGLTGGFWGQSGAGGGGMPQMPQMPAWPTAAGQQPQGWAGMMGSPQGFQQGLQGLWDMINKQGGGFSMNGGGNNAGAPSLANIGSNFFGGGQGQGGSNINSMPGGFMSNGSAYR